MMSLTFGLFTQVSGSGPLGPLVYASTTKVTNYDPGLTLTHFTSRSNLVT